MIRALFSAASGMTAQQLNVDNIATTCQCHTAGYKMRRAQFQDLPYQNMSQPGSSRRQQTTVPTGLQPAWARAPRPTKSSSPRQLLGNG